MSPKPKPSPARRITIDISIAGEIFTKSYPSRSDATQAFARLAAKAYRGAITRVVLWDSGVCVDAAGPGFRQSAPAQSREILPPALSATTALPAQYQAHSGDLIADLEPVCHCGQPVRPFMARCSDCPGASGAGKALKIARNAAIAATADLL